MLWGREEGATDGAGGAEYESGRVGVEGWVAVVMMEIAGTLVALEKSLCPLNHLAIFQIEYKEMR